MFRNFGIEELLLVLVIALLVFGAAKLPQIGEDLGKAVRNFRKGLSGEEDRIKAQVNASINEPIEPGKDDGKRTA
jgi:sec-independent protein translocase protein TatA